jgi:hypothetical protein
MNINDPKTLSVAEAVKKVLAPSVKLSEAKMKQLHALYGKGITDPKKLAAELELPNANDEKVIAAVAALVADMEETVASSAKDQSHIDAHDVEKHDDPEQKKQVESTQITEDVTDFRGFKSKDKLVKFTSMAKKLKIKPVGNPTIMKRMGTEYHVQGFSGKVGDIEKSIKVAVEIEKGTIESIDFTKEGNEFTAAAAKAKLAGEDEFEFDGKKYPVEIGQDAAEKILGKKESVELQEAANFGDIEKVMKWAKKNLSGAKLDISKKYGTAFINLTIMNVITLRLGGKKGIVVIHDDRTNGKGKDYEEYFSSANDVIKFVEKIYDEMPKDESVEESTDLEEESKLEEALLDEAINYLLEDESINIEEMSDEELEEMLEGILGSIGRGLKKAAGRLSTSGRAAAASKKADKLDKKAADREKLKKAKERIQIAKAKARRQKGIERAQKKKAAEKKAAARARLAKRDEGFVIEADAPKKVEAEMHEAIKPEEFVKGGDAKITKRDVDKMISKIFINTKLASQVEDSEAYQSGEKDAGKKKNPYKKDTADFHLYELGTQSAQAS